MIEKIIEMYSNSEHLIKPVMWGLLVGSIFLDVSKIKIDPWKPLVRKFGAVFNSEVLSNIKSLTMKITEVEQMEQVYQLRTLRKDILRFSDLLRNGNFNFSKETFDSVKREVVDYEALCEILKDPNNVTNEAIKYIDEIYVEKYRNNGFL